MRRTGRGLARTNGTPVRCKRPLLEPAGFTGAPVGFDIGYTLRSTWYGLFSGDPLANVLNKVDWSGTVRVTYGYAAVPEPATWAMLLLGFGLVGSALRTRRLGLRASGS